MKDAKNKQKITKALAIGILALLTLTTAVDAKEQRE
jgi:hypothetical protein